MMLSANLGFLWTELPLIERVPAAKRAGFDAVECHWPYDTPVLELKEVLAQTGLPMLSINTERGNPQFGEFGLSALNGREAEARVAIDQAIEYAAAIQTPFVHVMAGLANGQEGHDCFLESLSYACARGESEGINILIEPLNHFDVPGYLLRTTKQAAHIIDELGTNNLKLLFDCYHVQRMEGEVAKRILKLKSVIGHIQIASVPDRQEPDHGELDYQEVVEALNAIEYNGAVGAEYHPVSTVEEGLGWMEKFRCGVASSDRT